MASGLPQISPVAWSGVAQHLNDNSLMRFYQMSQMMQYRNQARQIAADRFMYQQEKNLTTTGMDANTDEDGYNDVSDMLKKKGEWEDFITQHQQPYLNPRLDGGKVKMQADQMYRGIQDIIDQSKQKVATSRALDQQAKEHPEGMTHDSIDMWNSHNLGVNNPNRHPADLTHTTWNPKAWTMADWGAFRNDVNSIKAVPDPAGPQKIATDPDTGKETWTTRMIFGNNELGKIAGIGSKYYNGSSYFKKFVDDNIANPSEYAHNAADAYKSHYGQDPTTPEQLASGIALFEHENAKDLVQIKSPSLSNVQKFRQQKELAAINSGNTLNRQQTMEATREANKTKTQGESAENIENRMKNWESNAKNNSNLAERDPDLYGLFKQTDSGGKPVVADRVEINPQTGTYTGTWFKHDENGVPDYTQLDSKMRPVSLSRETIKNNLGKKEKGATTTTTNTTSTKKKIAGF